VRDLFLLTLKPVMYVANVREDGFENNPFLDAVRAPRRHRGCRSGAGLRGDRGRVVGQLDDADRTPSSPTWVWTSPA
jgi:hypothetical protein